MSEQIKLVTFVSKRDFFRYTFRTGVTAHFVNHLYATQDPREVEELEREGFYLDVRKQNEQDLEVEEVNSVTAMLKAKWEAEWLQKHQAGLQQANDLKLGEYEQGKLKALTSADMAVAMGASNSGDGAPIVTPVKSSTAPVKISLPKQ